MKSIFFVSVILISFAFCSCQKETDCIATIKCIDSTGVIISDANVSLYAIVKNSAGVTYTADVKANGVTNSLGEFNQTFALPGIYDILSTYTTDKNLLITGKSIIKLEEGKTIVKIVTLK